MIGDLPLSAAVSQVAGAPKDCAVVQSFFDPSTYTITHVVHDPATGGAAIIDSVLDFDPASGRMNYGAADVVADYVTDANLQIEWLLETHVHADHLSAAPYLKRLFGGKIAIGADIALVRNRLGKIFDLSTDADGREQQFDMLWRDGDRFRIGSLDVTALHVPGHTPADMAYIVGDAAFVGDTMFMPDYGTARADFPGGDARQLFRSLRRLLALPGETRIFLCHDYLPEGRQDYCWETTVDAQREGNIHAHNGIGEDEFVAMREARDASLPLPRLLLPSIQVNMRAGHLLPAEPNGVSYLKIPLNQF